MTTPAELPRPLTEDDGPTAYAESNALLMVLAGDVPRAGAYLRLLTEPELCRLSRAAGTLITMIHRGHLRKGDFKQP